MISYTRGSQSSIPRGRIYSNPRIMNAPYEHPPLPQDLNPVLIIMLDHHLGNFCVALPVMTRLASYFEHPPDLLVFEAYAELTRSLGLPSRVLSLSRSGRCGQNIPNYVSRCVRLGFRRYAAVIDIGGEIKSTTPVLASHAPIRVGESDMPRNWIYNRKIISRDAIYTFDRYTRILQCIGERQRPPLVRFDALADSRREVMKAVNGTKDKPPRIAVIHPGAGKHYRLWPAERFAAVADDLVEKKSLTICFIGGPGEQTLMNKTRSLMRNPQAALCLNLTLVQLVALFDMASIYICNESGPMHLAAMTDLPIVAIFGPTPEARWLPVRNENVTTIRGSACDPTCGQRVCTANSRCMMELSVEEVLAAAEPYLTDPDNSGISDNGVPQKNASLSDATSSTGS